MLDNWNIKRKNKEEAGGSMVEGGEEKKGGEEKRGLVKEVLGMKEEMDEERI